MKKTIDKFVYFIVIAAIISSIYSIYFLYKRGGFELLIVDKINRTIFIISMYIYYRKGNPIIYGINLNGTYNAIRGAISLVCVAATPTEHYIHIGQFHCGIYIFFIYCIKEAYVMIYKTFFHP